MNDKIKSGCSNKSKEFDQIPMNCTEFYWMESARAFPCLRCVKVSSIHKSAHFKPHNFLQLVSQFLWSAAHRRRKFGIESNISNGDGWEKRAFWSFFRFPKHGFSEITFQMWTLIFVSWPSSKRYLSHRSKPATGYSKNGSCDSILIAVN